MANGDNNNMAARSYSKEFKELLKAVFAVRSYFGDFFGGELEAIDGITNKDTAFSVKTSDVACVVTKGSLEEGGTPAYNTGANVGMGTGTGSTSRFGNRTEVIYVDTDVPYTWDWVFHEGIDRHTVNNDFESAVADRLDLQAQKKTINFNAAHSAFISNSAEIVLGTEAIPTAETVLALFNALNKAFVNAGAVGTKVAKVTPDVYAAIVDTKLMTTEKGSKVNIDRNEVEMFKDFVIEQVPESAFQSIDCVYAYITGVGKAFTGIETARTIESEDFDGVALQGAGKAGEWILPDNKAAVAKVKLIPGSLTLASEAGTNSGDTKITVTETLGSGNKYLYKVGTSVASVEYDEALTGWSSWNGSADITAATGKILTLVEATSDNKVRKAGTVTVTAHA